MAKRNARKKYVFSTRVQGLSLIIVGTLFVTISTAHNILKWRSLRLDRATVRAYETSIHETAPEIDPTRDYPTHIFIKWFVDTDIEPEVYQNNKWTVSENSASYLTSSAKIGEIGNTIVYGHNKRSIMGNIRALKGGETIEITTKKGDIKQYKIASRQEVSPDETRLLQPTSDEVLTLYTCSGFMDSRRFVVRAVPLADGNIPVAAF